MAKKAAVWGIDIGQCALKALRCTLDGDEVVADAFDYIEYPKILSQPEAEPQELIKEALEQFLSRNDIKGCKVAMSVPGQSGLAKFFKPPPVDAKKIPDIVKYEARQQIPFDLDDVIWDYQQMGGASEVDGFALETEVGLFAMKREQVFRSIKPFENAAVELDIVQLAPLSVYNFITHDVLAPKLEGVEFDPENPPESLVVLSMGTDTTDLVVTNGFRVWQRSIPLGGNHFTKQLTKDLKLTFAKAEHLKRNALQAEDPKMVFQAMRPVFNDLVTEVQRSIGFFQSIDRKARIGGVVILGNTVKLPGLQQYLAKNLGYEVENFQGFQRLQGDDVISSPAFKDNALAFGVCYGLCLQGLGNSRLSTNLVPREILTARLIREKKPWALASVGALLLACSFNFFFQYSAWQRVQKNRQSQGVAWSDAEQQVASVKSESDRHKSEDTKRVAKMAHLTAIGNEVVGNRDRRVQWLEVLRAINQALPRDPDFKPGVIPNIKDKPFSSRQNLNIEYLESEFFPELKDWFDAGVQARYRQTISVVESHNRPLMLKAQGLIERNKGGGDAPAWPSLNAGNLLIKDFQDIWGNYLKYEPKGATFEIRSAGGDGQWNTPDDVTMGPDDPSAPAQPATETAPVAGGATTAGPEGEGWVIELQGEHFFNSKSNLAASGAQHVRNTLLKNLETMRVTLPVGGGQSETFTMKELGINYAILQYDEPIDWNHKEPNPNVEGAFSGGGGDSGFGAGGPPGGGGLDGDLGDGDPAGDAGPGVPGIPPGGGGASGPAGGGSGTSKEDEEPALLEAPRYSFRVQFCWQPQGLRSRLEAKRKSQEERAEELKKMQEAEQAGDVAALGGGS